MSRAEIVPLMWFGNMLMWLKAQKRRGTRDLLMKPEGERAGEEYECRGKYWIGVFN